MPWRSETMSDFVRCRTAQRRYTALLWKYKLMLGLVSIWWRGTSGNKCSSMSGMWNAAMAELITCSYVSIMCNQYYCATSFKVKGRQCRDSYLRNKMAHSIYRPPVGAGQFMGPQRCRKPANRTLSGVGIPGSLAWFDHWPGAASTPGLAEDLWTCKNTANLCSFLWFLVVF